MQNGKSISEAMKEFKINEKKMNEAVLMYDKNDEQQKVKKGDKVLVIQNHNNKKIDDDKNFLDFEDVKLTKGMKGKVTNVDSQGEVRMDWGKFETSDMANTDLSEYIVLA